MKKSVIFILMFILLVSSVSAFYGPLGGSDVASDYLMADLFDDTNRGLDTHTPDQSSSSWTSTNTEISNNLAFSDNDGGSGDINVTEYTDANRTAGVWFKASSNIGKYLMMRVGTTNLCQFGWFGGATDSLRFFKSGGFDDVTGTGIHLTAWQYFTTTHDNVNNQCNYNIYSDDGTLLISRKLTEMTAGVTNNIRLSMSNTNDPSSWSDNLSAWNGDVADIPTTAPNPTVTLDAPQDNNNTNIDVNFTFTVGGVDTDNCTLYTDVPGTFQANASLSPAPVASYDFGKLGLSTTAGTYVWNTMCMQDGVEYWAGSNYTYTVDLQDPNITLNTTYSTFDGNGRPINLGNIYNETITYWFDLEDERKLYAYEVNLTLVGGSTNYYHKLNQSLTTATASANDIISVGNLSSGKYTLHITVSDSHTKQAIKDYIVTKQKSRLHYRTSEGANIYIESDNPATTENNKLLDRYTFSFDFDDKQTRARAFSVKSDRVIKYVQSSTYKAHFIVGNGVGGNWIDFGGVPGTPTIIKINDYHYRIVFPSINSKVTFNSIGGLNTNTKSYPIFIGKYNDTSPNVAVGSSTTFILNLTYNTDFVGSAITANLTYDGSTRTATSQTSELVSGTTYNGLLSYSIVGPVTEGAYKFTWNVNVPRIGGGSYEFVTEVSSHSVTGWAMLNCSQSPPNVNLYFEVNDEQDTNPNSEIGSLDSAEILAQYWVTTPDNYQNYTANYGNITNLTVCINVPNMSADFYVKYKSTNGYTHRYFINNLELTNTTTIKQSLYGLTTTTGISQLRLTSRYLAGYNYYIGAYVSLERLFPSSNEWRTVQMGRTDDYGFTSFNIEERSTDYRLIYRDQNNHILKVTNTLTFACDVSVCTILALLSPFSDSINSNNITLAVDYDNDTNIITVDWLNGAEANITISILQENAVRTNKIFSDTIFGDLAGTNTYNMTGYTGLVQVRVNSIDINGNVILSHSEFFNLRELKLDSYIGNAAGAFFAFMILLVVISFGLWSPVAVIMAALFGLLIIYFLGIVSAINLTFLIIASFVGVVLSFKLKQ